MRIDILTLFPDMCERVLIESIIGRARQAGIVDIHAHNIRDYTENKQKQCDDYPYGGGHGVIMTAQPIASCFKAVCEMTGTRPYMIYMSPRGQVLTQEKVRDISRKENISILCGHYEGVDQRVIDMLADEEISVGDYVLTGGELPALVLTDAVCRMLPGVLAIDADEAEESHYGGLLEYPQYTRPAVWEGREVPEVLLSGHHENIAAWRKLQSLEATKRLRPDLFGIYGK